jgi:hypothetical protein
MVDKFKTRGCVNDKIFANLSDGSHLLLIAASFGGATFFSYLSMLANI